MRSRRLAVAVLAASLVATASAARAADDATLLRVFLTDGTALVSYGEPARVGERVVFSMPTASSTERNPPLHLVNLPADRVDWDRTNRYAESARAAHYLESQAELDYAGLSSTLAETLNEVTSTNNPSDRLAIVERARRALADWPQNHYNYRQPEVRQMIGMLDEAIADLRAASGANRIELSYTAVPDAAPFREPLLPPPTLRESIEHVLAAARATDSAADRVSLLSTALVAIDRDRSSLPADWAATTRAGVESTIGAELRIDRSYSALTRSVLASADRRARVADVRGVERLLARVQQADEQLGRQRPEAVGALVDAVESKLDATRRLRLARDRWELRLPVLSEYGAAIRAPFALFAQLRPSLEDIKSLSGSSPTALRALKAGTARLVMLLGEIAPPDELVAAHALMVSAAQLALNAANIRLEATLANDIDRAWNASSAAAGALMLGGRARTDILALLRPPQLR
jgi:hypothetical protein